MKITTLWAAPEDGVAPWLIVAFDENTFEEQGEVPPFYAEKAAKYPDARELIIEIDDGDVARLFEAPTARGTTDHPGTLRVGAAVRAKFGERVPCNFPDTPLPAGVGEVVEHDPDDVDMEWLVQWSEQDTWWVRSDQVELT